MLFKSDLTEALKFIREFAITVGNEPIKTTTIYYAYCCWKAKQKRQSRQKFIRDFSKVFKVYKKGKYRYADLSNFPKQFNTTWKEETYFLKQSYVVRNGKKKKQQEESSKKKTSRT